MRGIVMIAREWGRPIHEVKWQWSAIDVKVARAFLIDEYERMERQAQ